MAKVSRVRVKPKSKPAPAGGGLTLIDACADPALFSKWFERDPKSWRIWFVFLRALFGLPMSGDQLKIFEKHTGRSVAPHEPATEAWLICGRRSGKSFILALVAVFLACCRSYREFLSPGERPTVLVIATDRKQARVILRYIRALITEVPMLKRLIEREWAEGIDLNGLTIEVASASFRSVRGYTLVAALLDEMAFWPTDEESATPDYEVLNAIRPGMATIPGAIMLCASSPYAKRGALYEAYKDHFGKDGHALVWQAATIDMNPRVPQSVIDAAYAKDPSNAAAEFGARFRTDIEGFLRRDAVEACMSNGIRERAPERDVRYVAFVDPSGGSADAFAMAIAHKDKDSGLFVLDCVRERKAPFAPSEVVRDFATTLKAYGVSKVAGDRYAGEWPREQFRLHGITYEPSSKNKSEIYVSFLPMVNSRTVDLLENERLLSQLCNLERRTARSGKDSVDHGPNQKDDVANAVAGALTLVGTKKYLGYDASQSGWGDTEIDPEVWERIRLFNYLNSMGGYWR